MLKVLSYSIWVGGGDRLSILTKMMRLKHPNIIGLVEATNSRIVEELSKNLSMEYFCMSGEPDSEEDWQVGILSNLPFVKTPIVHSSSPPKMPLVGAHVTHSLSSLTKPMLEVSVEEANGNQLTIFVTHLIASFNDDTAGDSIRKQELKELLYIMEAKQGLPLLLMGDFSAIAPNDQLKGSIILRYILNLQNEYNKNPEEFLDKPTLDYIIPSNFFIFKFFKFFLPLVLKSKLLCNLFDFVTTKMRAPHGNLSLLLSKGYIDCFRSMNPTSEGFTAPTVAPSARLDYIFASSDLKQRLISCSVIEKAEDVRGVDASDHFPVFAVFR